jgi:hypothetical protein
MSGRRNPPQGHTSKKAERGPEPETRVEVNRLQDLEYVRERAEPLLSQIAVELRMSEDDVARLAVILFGRWLDLSQDPDSVVLVVKGTITPYDSAVQVLVSSGPHGRQFEELITELQMQNEG